jgi:hypothetical protein
VDMSDASPPVTTSINKQNTAITTAATTDIVAAPGASTRRNVKTINIRNKHASSLVDVTVNYNQNGTLFELFKATLLWGECLEYIEGIGWFVVQKVVPDRAEAAATIAQIASHSADTYYLGLNVGGRLQAGSSFRWKFRMSKGAAGTATPVYTIRFGTNGTTGDTARVTLTGAAQTAAADEGWVEVDAAFRVYSASAVLVANHALFHRLTTTGFSTTGYNVFMTPVVSSAFDATVADSIIGLSVNPGTSGAWVTDLVTLDAMNLVEA